MAFISGMMKRKRGQIAQAPFAKPNRVEVSPEDSHGAKVAKSIGLEASEGSVIGKLAGTKPVFHKTRAPGHGGLRGKVSSGGGSTHGQRTTPPNGAKGSASFGGKAPAKIAAILEAKRHRSSPNSAY
jgi:hypothetical protein